MGVGVECKQEGVKEETSSSVVDTVSNASLTVATAIKIPITEQADAHQPEPASVDTSIPTIGVRTADDALLSLSTEQPANKRIKLDNEATRTIATPSEDAAVAGNVTDSDIGISSNAVAKATAPIATPVSVPIGSSSETTKPVASTSASAGCDSATTSVTTTTMESSAKAKPQHSVIPMIANGEQQQSEAIPSTGSPRVTQNVPVKVEASSTSSNNNQGGSSSVVTESVESSPQHTSQSSNTSADSSNESLHDSETNPSIAIAAPPTTSTATPTATSTTTSTKTSPSANIGAAPPVTARTTVPAAGPIISRPPMERASPTTTVTQKHMSLGTEKSAGTSPSKPVPARTRALSSSASSTTTAPGSNTSTNTNTNAHKEEVPLKALNFGHLRIKYLGELEYMLREFRKLERQLLGAKGAQQLEESVGSRERREKLHSFILHLEDTIRQIEIGCKIEVEGDSDTTKSATKDGSAPATANGSVNNPAGDTTSSTSDTAAEEAKKQMAQESALSHLTKEKEEEETVQKLEEHILANLLPVKVRLKKQLAAQQGATQNPPGMPAMRRGTLQPSSTTRGKGTFVEAVEKKRKHAESLRLAAQVQHERQVRSVSDPTQFGKPLSGVGSSLTKKLHGSTLGSKHRRTGHGVGSSIVCKEMPDRKILHAGMVPKSNQQKSGLSAASGAHEILKVPIQNTIKPATAALASNIVGKSTLQTLQASSKAIAGKSKRPIVSKMEPKTSGAATTIASDLAKQNKSAVSSSSGPLSEEDKLKFKKHRRLRKLKRLKRRREKELARQQLPKCQQQLPNNTQSASNSAVGRKKAGHGKGGQKKKGPRVVEYICSQCSEAYSSTCDLNPWWALAQHKCPKCQKTQIPRIDITSPANAIEYHPALLSHLEDGGRGGGGSIPANNAQTVAPSMPIVSQIPDSSNSVNSESDSDLSELSDDNVSIGSLKAAELESELQSMTPAERAEHETFGKEYEGPVLSEEHAAKLLILMGHASTCPCHHKSEKIKDVCRSTKYMMLHVRDCPGTTSTCDVCPFPWCRKIKHLLYHLVSCSDPDQCAICSPKDLPKGLQGLVGLNGHRIKKHRERLLAIAKTSLTAKGTKPNPATKKQTTTRRIASATQANSTRKVLSDTKPSATQQSSAVQRHASAQAPVKPKIENVQTLAPYISSTTIVASGDKGGSKSNHVRNPMAAQSQPHPAMAQSPIQAPVASIDLDFDINAEIAKLDEHLETEAAQDANQMCTIIPMKQEPETITTIPNAVAVAGPPTTNYTTMPASETTTNDHVVLPTPVAAIKMKDHDADAAELNDLLATNSTSEEHHAISNPLAVGGDVGDVSEYLKNEYQTLYQIPPQQQQDSVMVTEHQQQIDINSCVPGVDTLNDPNSDPLANINHEIFIEPSDLPHTTMVPDPTSTDLKQEYSEGVSATTTSIQPSPNVSAVTTTATDVEKTVGSVKVN